MGSRGAVAVPVLAVLVALLVAPAAPGAASPAPRVSDSLEPRTAHDLPAPRHLMSTAYDWAKRRVVLFGGADNDNYFGDMWTWNGTTWTQQHPAISPPPRSGAGMAYDAAGRQVVLFGGMSSSTDYLGDTWTWDGTTWTEQHPPLAPTPRTEVGMAYDAARRQVVLFGGAKDDQAYGVTWAWDGTTWTVITNVGPKARSSMGMAYDGAARQVVVFGGLSSGAEPQLFRDTWTWDGTAWTIRQPSTAPSRRFAVGMAYDAARRQVVLFAGQDRQVVLDDTWTWSAGAWTQVSPPTSPSARAFISLSYAGAGQAIVLFGGCCNMNDTWTWDGTTWTEHSPRRAHGSIRPAVGTSREELATCAVSIPTITLGLRPVAGGRSGHPSPAARSNSLRHPLPAAAALHDREVRRAGLTSELAAERAVCVHGRR